MKSESTIYSIQSEVELKQYDCLVTLYFTGDGWDTDVESSINHTDLEEAKSICKELKERFPDIKIQILKIESKTETEYISV
ncbi:hypothetical protein KAR91_55960 [Candidatus Pacearchaeota archaeon]|nr:hypothetical protein [Candidatus Pacearchaeota archaeon]